MGDDDDEPDTVFPVKEAQWEHLVSLQKATVIPSDFKPGDRVRYRAGTGPIRADAKEKTVIMFWRFLALGDERDLQRITNALPVEWSTTPVFDCQIARWDGKNTLFDVTCSYLLERDAE